MPDPFSIKNNRRRWEEILANPDQMTSDDVAFFDQMMQRRQESAKARALYEQYRQEMADRVATGRATPDESAAVYAATDLGRAKQDMQAAKKNINFWEELNARAKNAMANVRPFQTGISYDNLVSIASGLRTPATDEAKEYAAKRNFYEGARAYQYEQAGQKAIQAQPDEVMELIDVLVGRDTDTERTSPARDTRTTAPMREQYENWQNVDAPTREQYENWQNIAAYNPEAEAARKKLREVMSDDEINQLVDYRRRQMNKEEYFAAVDQAQKAAAEHPVLQSARSVGTNIAAGAGYVNAALQKVMDPNAPIDYYNDAMIPSAVTNAIRGQVASDIENNTSWEIAGVNVPSFLYQSGMSMADSGVNMGLAALGIPPAVGLAILGGSAATTAMQNAHERGLNDTQTLLIGGLSGAAEIVTERIGLDTFMNTAFGEGGKKGVVEVLKNVLAEGGEEVGSDIINLFADILVAGDRSEWAQSVADYKAQGMSDSEAFGKAMSDHAMGMAQSFAGGALPGGIMGGIGIGVNNARYKGTYGADSAALVQEALDIDPDNKVAQAAQKHLDEGKTLSGDTMRRLVELNETAIEQEQQRPAETEETPAEQPALTVDETTALERQFGKAGAEAFVKAKPKNVADITYYHAFNMAFQYGNAGVNLQRTMEAVGGRIPGEVTMAAYAAGKGQADFRTEQAQIKLDRAKISATPATKIGKVTFDGVDDASLTTTQRSSVQVLNTISKVTGINFQVFASATDKTGKFVGENGSYDPKTNTIRVDINAGRIRMNDLNDVVMLKTTSHELTHFIQKNNPTAYRALKQFVSQQITDKGMNLEQLIQEKITRSKGGLAEDEALDEVVADACEDMLKDTTAIERLARENRSLFDKIRDWLRDFHDALKRAFAGNGYAHKEAQAMLDRIEELQKLWDDALVTAVQNYQQTGEVQDLVTESGKTAGVQGEDGSTVLSLRTYDEGGREIYKNFLDKEVKAKRLTRADADDMMQQLEQVYQICQEFAGNEKYGTFSAWSHAEVRTDPETGKPVFSVVKANGEYALNLDFSLVCKKRRTLDAVFQTMITDGIMEDFGMVESSIAYINDIIRRHGFETACSLCFVDSKRYRQAMVADAFVGMYNELVRSMIKDGQHADAFNYGGNTLVQNDGAGIDTLSDDQLDFTRIDEVLASEDSGTVLYKIAKNLKEHPQDRKILLRGDFMSAAAFDNVKQNNPRVMSLYNAKKGAGGPKASSLDVQYLNEIIQPRKFNVKKAYSVGGVRIQSFSDYVPRLVFDYVQMIADLSGKKLPAHAYTKEAMFALQFGMTGIKTNMSLVPEVVEGGIAPGLDKDGNYAWRDGQSFGSTVYGSGEAFIRKCCEIIGIKYTGQERLTAAQGFELAKAIQSAAGYSGNCGTIAVGVSDAHIFKLLRDNDVRMVIPYHKSSLNHIVAVMENIDKFHDYTGVQNTRKWNGTDWVRLDKGEKDFNFNDALRRTGDAKAAADEYLAWCAKKGYMPKFDTFMGEENYYKLLEDFTCYDMDGNAVPQSGVTMTLPTADSAFGSLQDMIQMGLEEDALLQGKQDAAVTDIVDEIKKTLPAFEAQQRVQKSERDVKTAFLDGRITISSTEEERYAVLKDATITPATVDMDKLDGVSLEAFNTRQKAEIDDGMRKLAKLLGVTGVDINASQLDFPFRFSNRSLLVSLHHQLQYGGTYQDYAKALTCFKEIVDSAIPIETHKEKKRGTSKENKNLEQTFVLLGAFSDGPAVIPVQMEVKLFKTNPAGLYLNVMLTKIDSGVLETPAAVNDGGVVPLVPKPTYTLRSLIANVNTQDGRFFKYTPDGFLDEERLDAKEKALRRQKDEYAHYDAQYSLRDVDPVQPNNGGWQRTIDTQEALRRFPGLWNVTAEESEVRNPTQIKSTVSTYRKIYDLLKADGFDGTILDASSGLGYGTRAGREEYGLDVDDIEPYPDASYKPRYTDYSRLNKTYDAIISNAVLNVLPQDQRDALVVKMGEMLNPGGKMYINVRGKDVDTLASGKDNVRISPMEWYVASTGSYQKGFTKAELKAYLEDALGPGYTVETTSKFGGVAVIVTKDTERVQRSDRDVAARDAEYLELAKDPTKNAARLQEMVDEAARAAGLYRRGAGEEINIYIPDGEMRKDGSAVSFIDMILDGEKLGETRGLNTHFPVGRWIGIAKNGQVVGRVKFGPAKEITRSSPEYADAKIAGTNYDIEPGQKKLYYPIVDMMDLRDNPRTVVRNGNYGTYQFKSSELITYDDNGNVIPISQRFNVENSDTRYSDRDVESFTTKDSIDAEIDRVMGQIRDIQNAQWQANDAAKSDPRVQEAQQKMWAAEDAKGYSGAVRERVEYRRILKQVKEELAAQIPEGDLNELAQRVQELKELREQYLKVTPITAAQYDKLAKHFGTTEDYGVAGFILKDGRMLDFSGKKQYGRAYSGGREVYHNEVGDVLGLPTDTSPRIDMVSNGNIRLVPEINGINLAQMPTEEQRDALRGFIEFHNGSVHVDIDNAAGRTVETFGYGNGTSASRILADIDNYFRTGAAPAAQSGLREFYSERDVEAISDRELLANALATVAQNPAERDILQRYQAKTAELGEIQTKLAEQRALMRDHISGAKKLSTEDLLKARNRAQLYAKQLDRADRELLKLESMGPVKAMLDREHKAYRKALKAEKRAEALRQRYNEKLTQQIEDSRQRMANYRQKRKETEARRKYKDRIKRIANDFRQMLLHPTDSRYSPVELLSSAYEIALMLDTSGEREDTKAKAKFNEQMRRLDDQYRALQESKDSDYATEYDPDFAYMVTQLRQRLAGRAIRDLSVTELEDVANVLHDINEMLKQAKYQLGKAERVTNYSVGESIIQQQREYAAESRSKGAQMAAGIERLSANTMRNVRRMTGYDDSAALAQLVQDLNEGIRKKNQFSMEANKLFDRLAGKRMQQATTEQRTYSLGGTQVQMTEMQAMQLILSWEREANNDITKHLTSGGILIPDAALMKKGQGNEAVRVGTMANGITQEDITAIYESMDEWARDYMDAARYFFNVLAQNAINEATMQTKHRRIATTRNYIPFEIDPDTVAQEIEGVKFDATIEGMGMLKSVQEGAANALVIRGLDTIIQRHIEKAGQVYGLAVPIRNYNKAMAIRLIGDSRTARASLHSEDLKLLDNAVRDLQTPRTRDRNAVTKIMDRLQSAFVKSTLLSNVSVTIKQAASYSTAGLYLSQKALAPYQGTIAKLFANNDSKFARDLFAEIDEHTAAHYIRRQGMSLQEAAMIAQDQGKLTRLMDERIKNDALNPLKWIQNMDVATTAALWLATKRQVEMDGTKPGDSDYWTKVTDLYNKVIEDTQPMYDVLHRPEIQRTTDSFLKSILMFKTQPLQNAGIIWDAVGQYAAAQKSGKGVAEAKAKLGRAVGSQVASLAVFAAMSFLAYAVKNRLGRYKDEEEELTVESVMKRILLDMASNSAGLVMPLFGSEAYTAIDGIVTRVTTGKQAYDALSAPMLDMVNGWIKDVGTVFTHLSDLDSHSGDIPSDLMTIGFDLSALFGIPAENVYNMVRGTVGNVGDWTGHPVDWATDESNTAKGMKAAWENGHYDTAKRKMNALIKEKMDNGKTEKDAKSAVKSSMTSYLKPLYIKAYRAKDNKEMDRVRKILVECGLYDDVAKTLATWVKDI